MAEYHKKLPYMPLYVGDWGKNLNLKMFTREEKFILIELMMLAWESEERGFLVAGRQAISNFALANILNLPRQDFEICLGKFLNFGLMKRREEDGALFEPDTIKRLKLSETRSEVGRIGGYSLQNKVLPRQKSGKKRNLALANAEIEITYNKLNIKREDYSKEKIEIYLKDFNQDKETFDKEFSTYQEFMKWIDTYAHSVNEMKYPIRYLEYLNLKKDVPKDILKALLKDMHNWKPLTKKNHDAYLTLDNWYKKRLKDEAENRKTPVFTPNTTNQG